MKKFLFKVLCVSSLGLWAGYAVPWQAAVPLPLPPEQEMEVEVACDLPEGPESSVVDPHALESAADLAQWGRAALEPGFPGRKALYREVSGLSRVLALLAPELAMAAAPPQLGGMPNFPVQPPTRTSWTLQGLANDEAEGAEGADIVEYGG
ncbi:MAG: hypothetical protein KF760_18910 [Candidatus Eremiobacteraeota bacterium]|nr:hypothetical protein [Candidatus Eremiobacteraeota bacterium]MCW5868470.1 hypothetical protein [Candidatus Eremiobacteraeota bacterium]